MNNKLKVNGNSFLFLLTKNVKLKCIDKTCEIMKIEH